jgi:hypothetical protein
MKSEVLDPVLEREREFQIVTDVGINGIWAVAHDLIGRSSWQE